jgi:hypothetical protein
MEICPKCEKITAKKNSTGQLKCSNEYCLKDTLEKVGIDIDKVSEFTDEEAIKYYNTLIKEGFITPLPPEVMKSFEEEMRKFTPEEEEAYAKLRKSHIQSQGTKIDISKMPKKIVDESSEEENKKEITLIIYLEHKIAELERIVEKQKNIIRSIKNKLN